MGTWRMTAAPAGQYTVHRAETHLHWHMSPLGLVCSLQSPSWQGCFNQSWHGCFNKLKLSHEDSVDISWSRRITGWLEGYSLAQVGLLVPPSIFSTAPSPHVTCECE